MSNGEKFLTDLPESGDWENWRAAVFLTLRNNHNETLQVRKELKEFSDKVSERIDLMQKESSKKDKSDAVDIALLRRDVSKIAQTKATIISSIISISITILGGVLLHFLLKTFF